MPLTHNYADSIHQSFLVGSISNPSDRIITIFFSSLSTSCRFWHQALQCPFCLHSSTHTSLLSFCLSCCLLIGSLCLLMFFISWLAILFLPLPWCQTTPFTFSSLPQVLKLQEENLCLNPYLKFLMKQLSPMKEEDFKLVDTCILSEMEFPAAKKCFATRTI